MQRTCVSRRRNTRCDRHAEPPCSTMRKLPGQELASKLASWMPQCDHYDARRKEVREVPRKGLKFSAVRRCRASSEIKVGKFNARRIQSTSVCNRANGLVFNGPEGFSCLLHSLPSNLRGPLSAAKFLKRSDTRRDQE